MNVVENNIIFNIIIKIVTNILIHLLFVCEVIYFIMYIYNSNLSLKTIEILIFIGIIVVRVGIIALFLKLNDSDFLPTCIENGLMIMENLFWAIVLIVVVVVVAVGDIVRNKMVLLCESVAVICSIFLIIIAIRNIIEKWETKYMYNNYEIN